MDFNNIDNGMWNWEDQGYSLEDNNTTEIPKSLLTGVSDNADDISYMFNDETTPVKACGDLAYNVTNDGTAEVMGKDIEQCRESSSQVKRRRMLQFESEVLDAPLCNDETFLRSKETHDSLEVAISEMSQWVAGFSEDTSASTDEGWIADCFNDSEMQVCNDDTNASDDVQIDITEICNSPLESDANEVKQSPAVHTHQNAAAFKGKKSYIRTTPKVSTSVVYPFAFVKPCGVHGGVTLNDINQRIHNPPKAKLNEEDTSIGYPTSAFSGKPVVGKTKIRTKGGKGSITIMRTKG